MKRILILLLLGSSLTFGQFKGQAEKPLNISGAILSDNPLSSLFSFLDPSKFSMNHSVSMSYSAFGSNGMALGVYTNQIAYKFNDKLNVEIETSLVNTPYNSLGQEFTKSINGIYLNKAQINYKPTKDMSISLRFSNSPFNYYNRYSNYGYGYSPFNNFWYDE